MKKVLLSIFVMVLTISVTFAQHYNVKHSDYNRVSVSFKSDRIQTENVKTQEGMFTKITMDEYVSGGTVGCPQLPILSKMLEIPLCDSIIATVENAQYDEYDAAELGIQYPIYPTQPSYSKSYTGDVTFTQNRTVYAANDFYANPLVRVEKAGTMRDITLANIYVSPVQYNPVTNRVRVYRSLDVTITYTNANIPGTYELKSKYGSPMFNVGSSAVINPIERNRNEFSVAPIKYLIIANSMFADNDLLNQFINWKKRIGYIVEVGYTNDPAVGSTTTSIKNYIMTHYNNATTQNPAPTFLLLIGDVGQLPAFNCTTSNTHVSDLYYATWTTGDNLPDCYYGRFSAQNISQLTPQIEKTLMYEQYTMPDPSYLGDAVLIAGTDGNYGPVHGDGQINYIYNNYVNTNSTTHNYTTVYKHNYNCSSQAATIRNEIGAGVGWTNYTAHGEAAGWADPAFQNSHVASMTNANKYGIMIGNCCLSGQFSTDCFGETLLRAANKGALIYVGASQVTYWDEDYYWSVGVRSSCTANPSYDASHLGTYDRAFHTHNESTSDWTSTMGAYVQSGNMAVQSSSSSRKLYYWEIYHIFGDPSIRPYLGIPTEMNVTSSDVLTVGTTSLDVTAAPFAYIALTYENDLVAATFADASGNATLNFSELSLPGEYELAVSAQNKIQYFKTINCIAPNGPCLVTNSIGLSPSAVPSVGSAVHWDLDVKNLGSSASSGAYAKMTCSLDGVTMITDSLYIGTINAGDSQSYQNAFVSMLPTNVEDGTRANFNVTLYWANGSTPKNTSITILAPKLELDHFTVEAPNGATEIAPGDIVSIVFTNKNNGHAVMPLAIVDLTSNYTGAKVISPSYSIYTLQPDQSTDNAFSVQIGNDVAMNTIIPLYYHMVIDNVDYIDTLFINIGAAMETFESNGFTQFPWNNTGSNPWITTTSSPYAGSYCARSKQSLGNSATSAMNITLNCVQDGNISFFRKVSSEQGYDKFSFAIDGTVVLQESGSVAWSQASFPVTAGTHTYLFQYAKDWSTSSGSDCAWIDNVVFPGYGTMAPQDTLDGLGVEEFNVPTANVSVYPNPATAQLTVSSNEPIRLVTIYDLSGRMIEAIQGNAENQLNLNVARLNSGIYFIRTQLENQQTKTSKFIKQ